MDFTQYDKNSCSCDLNRFIKVLMFCVTVVLINAHNLCAQQTPYVSHYFYNPYLINPAAIADSIEVTGTLIYRQQWAGVPDAPETQMFCLSGMIPKKRIGLGMLIGNDVTNIVSRFSGVLSASYTVNISNAHYFSFGMSAGILRYQLNFDKVRADLSDPGILLNAQNASRLEGSAGIRYRVRAFRMGLISEQIFNRTFTFLNQTDSREIRLALVRHYSIMADYKFRLTKDLSLRPQVLLKAAQGLPTRADGNAMLIYRDLGWINLQHRFGISSVVAIGARVTSRLTLGYSYELPGQGIGSVSSGSHELMLGLKFASADKQASSIVSERRKNKNAEGINPATSEQLDELRQKNETLNQTLVEQQNAIIKQNDEIKDLRKLLAGFDLELQTIVDQNKIDIDAEGTFDKNFDYMVVIGAVKNLNHANAFRRMIGRERSLETFITKNNQGTWFFICTAVVSSKSEAKQTLKSLEAKNILPLIVGNPWIYKSLKQ